MAVVGSALGSYVDPAIRVGVLDRADTPASQRLVAALRAAPDLAVLGYEIVIYDQDPKLGGFIRTQIPHFRLPESVIDEEVGFILDLGVTFKQRKIYILKALMS